MRLITLVLLFIVGSAEAKVAVRYQVTEMQGLCDFAFALAGRPHLPPGFKEIYERSDSKTPEVEAAIQTLRDLAPVLNQDFNFETPVADRPRGEAVEDQLLRTLRIRATPVSGKHRTTRSD